MPCCGHSHLQEHNGVVDEPHPTCTLAGCNRDQRSGYLPCCSYQHLCLHNGTAEELNWTQTCALPLCYRDQRAGYEPCCSYAHFEMLRQAAAGPPGLDKGGKAKGAKGTGKDAKAKGMDKDAKQGT